MKQQNMMKKFESFNRKFSIVAEPYSMYGRLLFNVGRKKLSHMEAQKSKSHYKSPAKSTDISGSYRAV